MARLSGRIKAQLDNSGSIVPIGTIVAYAPGYFGAVSNGGGWTAVGPATNDVAGVNAYLPPNWRVCDGSAPNDPESPIFNAAGRFLPELTGSRFVMGFASAGNAGGNTGNQVTLTTTELPNHNHGVGTYVTQNDNANHDHGDTFSIPTSGTHSHGVSDPGHFHGYGVSDPPSPSGSPRPNNDTNGVFTERNTSTKTTGISVTTANSGHSHPITGSVSSANAPHNHTISGSSAPAGSGNAFSILPLYVSAFYIMRIK